MHCEAVQEQLKRFAAGDLPVADRQAVQAHLDECVGCHAKLAAIDALAGIFARTPTPPISPRFASRVMAAARQRTHAEASWSLWRWWRLTSPPMHAAAVAVLVVGLGLGAVMSWTAVTALAPTASAAQQDPAEPYRTYYFDVAPSGSLADSYRELMTESTQGGR